jgi:hypothetical protein
MALDHMYLCGPHIVTFHANPTELDRVTTLEKEDSQQYPQHVD